MEKLNNKSEHGSRNWSSKFGFLMATIGSAVGLGNIWRFPYIMGQNGGAIFLIVYLIVSCLLGFTLISAELAIGRKAQTNVVDAYTKPKKHWKWIGVLNNVICFIIISFYAVICGWLLKYIFGYLTGAAFLTSGDYAGAFGSFIAGGFEPLIFLFVFLAICAAILFVGVQKGIERTSKFMMPALFALLIFAVVVALTMNNAIEGLKFFFVPDFERVGENGGFFQLMLAAIGQAFFSLSIGLGISTTYGSYLKYDTNIPKSSIKIIIADTLIALLAGCVIFPAAYSAGMSVDAGPSLIFITLPAVFATLGFFGNIMGLAFFILLLFAGITSCIALSEVNICTIVEKTKLSRKKTTVLFFIAILVSTSLVSLSQSGIFHVDLLTVLDDLVNKFLLPIAALLTAVYVGYIWTPKSAIFELTNRNTLKFTGSKLWSFLIKFIVPLLILLVMIFGLI